MQKSVVCVPCVCVCVSEMSTTQGRCANMSRLLHDISHLYALLLLTTDNKAARNLLITTAEQLHKYDYLAHHYLVYCNVLLSMQHDM